MMVLPKIKKKRKFKWSEIHKKIGQIIVIEPNPECLEFTGMVALIDEDNVLWILKEWSIGIDGEGQSWVKETGPGLGLD